MTLLLPTPRTVAYAEFHEVTIRLRNLVLFWLTRPSSGPRHRLRTARQIRWQRWKSALARRLDPGLTTLPLPPPRPAVRPHGQSSRVPGSSAQHPPPRTAQSPASAAPDDDQWADRRAPAVAYALPNTAPTSVPDSALRVVPLETPRLVSLRRSLQVARAASRAASAEPVTRPLTWLEEAPEPWAEPWHEPWHEPWVEPQDETGFTGHVQETGPFEPARPVATFYYPAEHGEYGRADRRTDDEIIRDLAASARAHTDRTAPDPTSTDHTATEWSSDWSDPSPADWPTAADPVPAHAADDTAHAAHAADDTAPVDPEDEDLWEFQVGDLARWWDEATARLDAAARDEVRNRLW
ncbi:hypothetical protein AB0425_29610 [Actinosynnema sp. NPDC051121]|nr:hypothetical protein [Saccharothrix sp.]